MFSTETIYEVVVFSVGDTKAGTKMGKLQLKDPADGSLLNCILWEETLNRMDSKVFRTGNQVRIVAGSFNEKFNNCLVSALELVKEAKVGLDEQQRAKAYKEVTAYFDKISDEKLRNFLKDYFAKHEEQIKIAPAAKVMHHNYVGGLLVHLAECLKFAEANLPLFECKVNKDNVLAACILHDIGKIFEYKINTESGLIDYNEQFKKDWLTHSQYGFSICMNEGFNQIARMIAAHHGRSDWGAIIDLNEKDLENELYIIHLIDNLSAKFGKISVSQIGE
ncbi:MAG: HD domain-containing protein [Heliobacteriaceae bacterium]|jgi:putative nucleotidyltransferase with HDIG domain|nr:HD domain-containing protein [Heliobacteriaceae bacterium]